LKLVHQTAVLVELSLSQWAQEILVLVAILPWLPELLLLMASPAVGC